MGEPVSLSRRRFLAATGLLGAAAAASQVPGFVGVWPARAQSADDLGPLLDAGAELLRTLAVDTIGGLVAFVVPGDDAYSQAQGVTAEDLGGIAADGHLFLMNALDQFLPVPDSMLDPLVSALVTGSSAVPIPIPPELIELPDGLAGDLDDALLALLANDQTFPLSAVIAMLVNMAATMAHPESAAAGTFLSPFANLDFAGKMDAWRLLEEDVAGVTAAIDEGLPQPLASSLSGLVEFVGGALVEFAAFGSFGEWAVFDADEGVATQRPVGWDMSRYVPGERLPANGWDEHLGYYGDVRAVEGSWDLDAAGSEA